jgi:phosphohistidine phosphatase
MILTIWRHGAAEEGLNDDLRELTSAGSDDVGFGCHQFHQACHLRDIPHITTIVHSPLQRTMQTAAIIAAAYGSAEMRAEDALKPEARVADVELMLQRADPNAAEEHIALVSHQPLVSRIVNHYLGVAGSVPSLPPGGLATLRLDAPGAGCATLLFWLFPPEFEAGI